MDVVPLQRAIGYVVMNRREFLSVVAASAFAANANRPNIVFILADDLGWGDLRCYNPESAIPTPNADRLASQGVRFTDMHSPSAVCTPTRYGILTGRYCWRSRLKQGVLWGYDRNLIEDGRTTVPSLLKSAGYATAGIGKWHLGLGRDEKVDYSRRHEPAPTDHGFDSYFGIPASLDMDPYVYIENDRTVEQPTATTPGKNEPRGVFWRGGPIAPGFKVEEVLPVITDRAVGYLRERAKTPEQPFFLYFALTAPHTPWLPHSGNRGKSGAGIYGDFVCEVDDTLGRIMSTLEETGLASSTVLIFTSDNGAHWTPEDRQKYPHRANGPWRGQKADIYEAGHRVPFLVRWPGKLKPKSVSGEPACLTDLMATVADMTGTALPRNAGEDSFSLISAMNGRKGARDHLIHHSNDGMFSIRQGEWKLIMGRGSGGFTEPRRIAAKSGEPEGQLFHIARDPAETNDVYAEHPEVVARLTALLRKYQSADRTR
jgi:arylsulfatase A